MPCPGKGLDLVAFNAQSIHTTPPAPEAEFAFVTGKNWRTELTGREANEDLLIDLFVLRNHGWSEYGPGPDELIGSINKDTIRTLCANVVQWHREKIHDPFHDPSGEFAVLNTCRAWRFIATGIMGSKNAGGEWALSQRSDLAVIDTALALRRAGQSAPLASGVPPL